MDVRKNKAVGTQSKDSHGKLGDDVLRSMAES
jgi:hypothetical protein